MSKPIVIVKECEESTKVVGVTPKPTKEINTYNGVPGKSAYMLALDQGFVGSLEDWFESLRGPVGPKGDRGFKGDKGDTGSRGAFFEYRWLGTQLGVKNSDESEFTYTDLKGEKGNTGISLNYVWDGTKLGIKHSNESEYNYVDLKGDQGIQGIQGIQGEKGDTGEKGDKGDVGDTGPSAYEVAISQGFIGSEVDWLNSLVGPQGEKGDKGDTGAGLEYLWNGTELGVRVVGDASYTFTNLIGPQGIQGEIGPQGPQGVQGEKGDKGDPGTTDYNDLINVPTEFNPSTHTHDDRYYTEAEIDAMFDGLTTTPDWTSVLNKPETATRWPAWGEVTGKPSAYVPSAHTHTIANVDGLQTALDGKAALSHSHNYAPIANKTTTSVNKTLINEEQCFVTTSGRTITLPASPSVGSEVHIGIGNFTNTTIARNGERIMGLAENMVIDKAYASISLRYIDSTLGWMIV